MMNRDSDDYVVGEKMDTPTAPKLSNDGREGDQKTWLLIWVGLGLLLCFAPALSSFLAWSLSLLLSCDSWSFDVQHVPLCSTGNNSLIYALGFAGQYGWVISIPSGVAVVIAGFILYAAAEKR